MGLNKVIKIFWEDMKKIHIKLQEFMYTEKSKDAVLDLWESTQLVMGEKVKDFELKFHKWITNSVAYQCIQKEPDGTKIRQKD